MHNPRTNRIAWRTVAWLALAALACTGCESDMAKEFRTAARPQLEAGVDSLVSGLLDGAFALWEPDTTTSTN
jgi:hypothetical protein